MASYSVTIRSEGSYLPATVVGENGREAVLGYFREVREACRLRDCYRLRVEERLEGPRFGVEELQELMLQVATEAGVFYEAFAYVDVNATTDTIARVARQVVEPGAAVGVFATVAEAERWLRAKEKGRGPSIRGSTAG